MAVSFMGAFADWITSSMSESPDLTAALNYHDDVQVAIKLLDQFFTGDDGPEYTIGHVLAVAQCLHDRRRLRRQEEDRAFGGSA